MEASPNVQLRTGIFTLAVLAALATVILFVTQEGGLFEARYKLYAHFDNIEGLTVNAPVWLAGNNIGRVSAIDFLAPGSRKAIQVELDLDASVQHRIRSDSRASIGTIGLLGDKYVELTSGSEEASPLHAAGVIQTSESPTFSQLAAKGRELLDSLVSLSSATESIVTQFHEAMGGQSLAATLASLARIAEQIEEQEGFLHTLIYDEGSAQTLRELDQTIRSVRAIVREVEEGRGTLHQLIYAEGEETAPIESLADSSRRLDSILRKIDEGEGTLGAMVNDPSLYEEARLVLTGARESALLRSLIRLVKEEEGN